MLNLESKEAESIRKFGTQSKRNQGHRAVFFFLRLGSTESCLWWTTQEEKSVRERTFRGMDTVHSRPFFRVIGSVSRCFVAARYHSRVFPQIAKYTLMAGTTHLVAGTQGEEYEGKKGISTNRTIIGTRSKINAVKEKKGKTRNKNRKKDICMRKEKRRRRKFQCSRTHNNCTESASKARMNTSSSYVSILVLRLDSLFCSLQPLP